MAVVIVQVLSHHAVKMAFVEDDHMGAAKGVGF
jgi:hypothetical protein